jgi:hypothetical protein
MSNVIELFPPYSAIRNFCIITTLILTFGFLMFSMNIYSKTCKMNPEEQYDTSMIGKAMKSKQLVFLKTLKKTVYPSKYLDGVLHFPPYRSILLELGLGQGQRPEKGGFYWTYIPPCLVKIVFPPVGFSPKFDLPGAQVKPPLEPGSKKEGPILSLRCFRLLPPCIHVHQYKTGLFAGCNWLACLTQR